MILRLQLPPTFLDVPACLERGGRPFPSTTQEHNPAPRCTCMLVGREFKSPLAHRVSSLRTWEPPNLAVRGFHSVWARPAPPGW